MEPLVLLAPKAPCDRTLKEAMEGLSALKPKANTPKYAPSRCLFFYPFNPTELGLIRVMSAMELSCGTIVPLDCSDF